MTETRNDTTAQTRRSRTRTGVRRVIRQRRQARDDQRARSAQLTSPRTPIDLDEFVAAVHRHAGTNPAELRAILVSNVGDSHRTR